MTNDTVDDLARILWEYHQLHMTPLKSDAIFTLCSIDTRVAEYASDLYLGGLGDYLIFSGGVAHTNDLLKTQWIGTEADHFAEIAIAKGVPKDKIIIENRAQNTGQNITLTHQILVAHQLRPKSLLLVQKPYMERRTYATFKKQWPEQDTKIVVTSPQINYQNYFDDANPKELVLNIMVGDLQRIKEYPALGFQIEQEIPDNVWNAYKQLIKLGYAAHLAK